MTKKVSENKKIFVAGHQGMVGSAIFRQLKRSNSTVGNPIITRSRDELDLIDQAAVKEFFHKEQPSEVYVAAAKVGGIFANNTFPADFLYENLMIQSNIIQAAFVSGVKRLLFLGSSCIYPRDCLQPMSEEVLLTGQLEPTNEPYAIAKIAGIKLCESYNRQFGKSHGVDYRCIMPTNLYGPGDNYHPTESHVLPGLIRKFHEGTINKQAEVEVWGSGEPLREFLYVDDMADASIHVMSLSKDAYQEITSDMCSHLNAGSGLEIRIKDLAAIIAEVVGFNGRITFNTDMPDGTPRKLVSSKRLAKAGWSAKVPLKEGIQLAYSEFLSRESI